MTEVQTSGPNQIAQGIAIILGSVLIMAFADAVVKLASADLTVWQIFVTRSLVAIPIHSEPVAMTHSELPQLSLPLSLQQLNPRWANLRVTRR